MPAGASAYLSVAERAAYEAGNQDKENSDYDPEQVEAPAGARKQKKLNLFKPRKSKAKRRTNATPRASKTRVRQGTKQWHHYLYAAQFEIVFDHESIKWFSNQRDLKGHKAKWEEILQDYDCQLRYRKGRYKVVTNALSRMPEINSLSFTELKREFLEFL